MAQFGRARGLEKEIFVENKMLDITQQKGTLTELHCITDLTELGIRCLTPIDDSSRYDVVADLGGKFIKIQCKTASWVTDTAQEKVAFHIDTIRQTTNTKATTKYKYTAEEVDYFYTYFEGQGYLISINEATGVSFRMRYEYPSNNQKKGIHIADNYKIAEVIKTI